MKYKLPIKLKYLLPATAFLAVCLFALGLAVNKLFFPDPSRLNQVYRLDEYRKNSFPYLDKSLPVETRVKDLLDRMTTLEKIGQLALIEKNSINDPLDVARYGLGGVLSGSGGKPERNTPAGWRDMADAFTEPGRRTRLGIPVLYGVDTTHGHSNVPGATIFPHSIGLGASRDAELVRKVAQATGEEMRATNIFWSYSPGLDVITDIRWGRTYESFGSDTALVSKLGSAYIEGMQDTPEGEIKSIATAKHYVGSGDMTWGTSGNSNYKMDQGISNISADTLRTVHLPPFNAAVKSGVKSVMSGHNRWEGKKMSANPEFLTTVLKQELGFQGFVVSDWYAVFDITPDRYQAIVTAINAGVDMVMLPFDYHPFIGYMEEAMMSGDISEERLNDAVSRILKVKFEMGLFDLPQNDASKLQVIGSAKNREIAREAVRKSLVLLKNENSTLPLAKNSPSILVAGTAANNLGRQMGGWTVEWQGIDGNWIPGTTILAGIKNAVSKETRVEFNQNGDFDLAGPKANLGIVVVGETPYSEGVGDAEHPQLTEEDLRTIQKTRRVSEKLVVIIVSGRPLDIKGLHTDWNAIVAAWLPGSEGQGVSDVLFGDYPFTGVLPVDWKIY